MPLACRNRDGSCRTLVVFPIPPSLIQCVFSLLTRVPPVSQSPRRCSIEKVLGDGLEEMSGLSLGGLVSGGWAWTVPETKGRSGSWFKACDNVGVGAVALPRLGLVTTCIELALPRLPGLPGLEVLHGLLSTTNGRTSPASNCSIKLSPSVSPSLTVCFPPSSPPALLLLLLPLASVAPSPTVCFPLSSPRALQLVLLLLLPGVPSSPRSCTSTSCHDSSLSCS